MRTIIRSVLLMAVFATLLTGCGGYQITQPLEQPLQRPTTIVIGTIQDDLPTDTPEKKKPSLENISAFRNILMTYLIKEGIAHPDNSAQATTPIYEVRGSILSHSKGSQTVRFLIGFGAGSSKITTHLELVEISSGSVLFAGNFKGSVADWTKSGDEMWDSVAKRFAKALKKQFKNLPGSISTK
jgi:Domain of unknown function (DUF4410)